MVAFHGSHLLKTPGWQYSTGPGNRPGHYPCGKKDEHILESYRELAQLLNNPMTFKDVARHLAQLTYKMFHYDAFCLNIFDLDKDIMVDIYNLDTPTGATQPIEVSIQGVHNVSLETKGAPENVRKINQSKFRRSTAHGYPVRVQGQNL